MFEEDVEFHLETDDSDDGVEDESDNLEAESPN